MLPFTAYPLPNNSTSRCRRFLSQMVESFFPKKAKHAEIITYRKKQGEKGDGKSVLTSPENETFFEPFCRVCKLLRKESFHEPQCSFRGCALCLDMTFLLCQSQICREQHRHLHIAFDVLTTT